MTDWHVRINNRVRLSVILFAPVQVVLWYKYNAFANFLLASGYDKCDALKAKI